MPVSAARLSLLGIAIEILAEDAALLATALAAYADTAAGPSSDEPPVVLRLMIGADDDVPADIRVDGGRLALSGPGVAGGAEVSARRAQARVPRRLVGDPAALAAEVTDTLLLFLLARLGRTPVHAAGIRMGDAALVLAGPSGSGKSTLALAAMERGLQIFSDDTLYIQLRPAMRVWGFRRPLHVFPEDAPRFTGAVRLRGGKLKTVVPLQPGAAGPPFADRAILVLPGRGDRLDLSPVSPEAAMARLGRLDAGFDLLAQESAWAAQALAANGAWRLTLTHDPHAAIDFLMERLSGEPG